MKKEVKRYECKCERCSHEWTTRNEKLPKVCPTCKSFYWDVEKKLKEGKKKVTEDKFIEKV